MRLCRSYSAIYLRRYEAALRGRATEGITRKRKPPRPPSRRVLITHPKTQVEQQDVRADQQKDFRFPSKSVRLQQRV